MEVLVPRRALYALRMPLVPVRIDINNLSWSVFQDRASKHWIGSCDALRLTASGETWERLFDDMRGAIEDLFDHLLREGDLASFLRRLGWRPDKVHLPKRVPAGGVKWDVPFGVLRTATPPDFRAAASA